MKKSGKSKRATVVRGGIRLTAGDRWRVILEKFASSIQEPQSRKVWSPEFETASRARIIEIQEEKLAAMVPYLYEESPFYRARFHAAKLKPADIRRISDLPKFPVVTKDDMASDVTAHPPWGTYTCVNDNVWRERGWMVFSTSGTTTTPRSFRYTALDTRLWASTSARALYAMGVRAGDLALTCTNYNPHVFFWSIHHAFNLMRVGVVPGGVATERRVAMIALYRPTILVATPSYALHLANVMRQNRIDPRASSIRMVICGGEAASGIPSTRKRIEEAWDAELHDVYGCTEAVPAGWAFTCHESALANSQNAFSPKSGEKVARFAPDEGDRGAQMHGVVSTHVQEDLQIWELVDPQALEPVAPGERGLTVVTNLNSEGSPQLRFLIGDFTRFDTSRCPCGRTFARAIGGFAGRADDMLNIRGLKLFPSAIEEIVRGIDSLDDEFQILLETQGVLDEFTIVAEARAHLDQAAMESIAANLAADVVRKCELRPRIRIEPPGTLPRTEFKARRVVDRRQKP